jgi:hypothetical protein
VIEVQQFFAFSPDWYCMGEPLALVGRYYVLLRTALRTRPHLRGRGYLRRCRHCRILFLTDPRNRGREDLGCPFGCRAAHRKKEAARRAAQWRSTPVGKAEKKKLNRERAFRDRPQAFSGRLDPVVDAMLEEMRRMGPAPRAVLKWKGIEVPVGAVSYLEGVLSLMECRKVGIAELSRMLERISRQRSMDRRGRMDYILSRLHAAPS